MPKNKDVHHSVVHNEETLETAYMSTIRDFSFPACFWVFSRGLHASDLQVGSAWLWTLLEQAETFEEGISKTTDRHSMQSSSAVSLPAYQSSDNHQGGWREWNEP